MGVAFLPGLAAAPDLAPFFTAGFRLGFALLLIPADGEDARVAIISETTCPKA